MKEQVEIIAENEAFIVVNKVAGKIVENNPFEQDTMERRVGDYLTAGKANTTAYVGIVHRLDKVTSGVLLFAKKRTALQRLNQLVSKRQLRKTYLAVVDNPPPSKRGKLQQFLRKDQKEKKAFIFDEAKKDTRPCSLSYQLLQENEGFYLLEIRLHTGRFHQIRAQLGQLGCPIVGDKLYGSQQDYADQAIALHAWKLSFTDQEKYFFKAKYPDHPIWNGFRVR